MVLVDFLPAAVTLLTCHAAAGSSLCTACSLPRLSLWPRAEGVREGAEQSYKVSTTDAVAAVAAAMAFAEPCNLSYILPLKYRVKATAEQPLCVCD